jgi:hypothetical protein
MAWRFVFVAGTLTLLFFLFSCSSASDTNTLDTPEVTVRLFYSVAEDLVCRPDVVSAIGSSS